MSFNTFSDLFVFLSPALSSYLKLILASPLVLVSVRRDLVFFIAVCIVIIIALIIFPLIVSYKAQKKIKIINVCSIFRYSF